MKPVTSQQRWAIKNRERRLVYIKAWKVSHPELCLKTARRASQRKRDELSDWYIRTLLSQVYNLDRNEIPMEMIQAKRVLLRAKRAGLIKRSNGR